MAVKVGSEMYTPSSNTLFPMRTPMSRQPSTQRLPRPQMVESAVALDRTRNLEGRRTQQAHSVTDVAVERNHRLDPEQTVAGRRCSRGIGDFVTNEVARPDRHSGHSE